MAAKQIGKGNHTAGNINCMNDLGSRGAAPRDLLILAPQAPFWERSPTLPDGRQVPLDVVTRVVEARDWARTSRIDGRRTVTVEANVDARRANVQAIVKEMRANGLDDFSRQHPGVRVAFEGQVARSAETGGSIGRGLLIGLHKRIPGTGS